MKDRRGQIILGVLAIVVFLLIAIPAIIGWMQNESRWAVKSQKSTTAFNFAEAGIDRGTWKLKSSTATWTAAAAGQAISWYQFDHTYTEIPGGSYRIQFSSGPLAEQVTIWAEGRDSANRETRSIQEVVQNEAVPGAIISGGSLNDSGLAISHWGPEVAMNNITLSGTALSHHYPRKLSNQAVLPYDTNGITPPNTDNLEWWSAYTVPDLPVLDFASLRSSAAATGTLNCNGNACSSGACTFNSNLTGSNIPCNSACVNCTVNSFYQDPRFNANDVWYWDHNVTINDPGERGTIIVRGNLTTQNGDWYGPYGPLNANVTVHVPSTAWMEYQKIDTGSSNQYPADNGFHSNAATYTIGACGAACEGSDSGNDVGFYGFVYVGGNVNFSGDADIYGAVWAVGNWSASGNNIIFFNDQLVLPALNVSLVRQSWNEVTPSNSAWIP